MEITLEELAQLINLVGSKQTNNQIITASMQTQIKPKNKRTRSLSRHSWTDKEFNVVEAMTRAGYSQKQIANELQLRVGQIDGAQMVLRKQGKLVQS
jgi:DNA-binding NarL/FixJ family response regulator